MTGQLTYDLSDVLGSDWVNDFDIISKTDALIEDFVSLDLSNSVTIIVDAFGLEQNLNQDKFKLTLELYAR